MKYLNVLTGFILTLADGAKREFEAGLQEIEDDLADHWYVAAHSEPLTAKQAKALQAASAAPEPAAEQLAPEPEPAAEPEAPAEPVVDAPTES
ncbi:STY1053 family phage-associated protein [Pseudomonas panipatensis]|uniref:Uncharacterized protein n=1 Tax=Pseudomonas panipatensis TaxID=428992 RepID=A0A1G8LF36_9PSED|nr:hypothetical protein [Pseudomonas panipatensis]SDI54309.1 hypothetical protein SAMN05216272_111117 [Pseudomonas panipatensis]SMP75028.1 hypothetical protein SAMN06295951_11383 [Pseudomonas panipatensis]